MIKANAVEFPSDASIHNLRRLQKVCQELFIQDHSTIQINLGKVRRFTPFTACYLVSLAHALSETGKSGFIRYDDKSATGHQIDYLGLVKYFADKPRKKSGRVPAVPFSHLPSENYDIAFKIATLIRDELKLSDQHFYLARLCLKELFQNSFEHSESVHGLYACAHGIRSRRIVRLCTLDRGIGIRTHLVRNPKYSQISSDKEALGLIGQRGVTGSKNSQRGLGLFYVKTMIEAIGGELVIASGRSMLIKTASKDARFIDLDIPFDGTIVNLTFTATSDYRFPQDDMEVT